MIGAEVMFDWAPNTQNTLTIGNPVPAPLGSSATATINSRWLTTVTGKLGYAWDRLLVYGKAGGAWVGADTPSLTTPGGVVFPSLATAPIRVGQRALASSGPSPALGRRVLSMTLLA